MNCCVLLEARDRQSKGNKVMLNLHSLFLALLLFVSVVLCVHGEDEKAEAAKAEAATLEEELPIHDCSKPDPGSHRHVDWINKLNGRRIVFLGDSPLRCEAQAFCFLPQHAPLASEACSIFVFQANHRSVQSIVVL